MSGPYVEIDLGALAANYRRVREVAEPATVAAVVKADAYGLGIGPVALALRAVGCATFFVATADEGAELREIVGTASDIRIFVLDGPVGSPTAFTRNDLIPVLNSVTQIERWADAGPAALHVDTGMNRLGLSSADLESLLAGGNLPSRCVLLMTHLACADEPAHPLTRDQVEKFAAMSRLLPGVVTSIGNSAGALLGNDTRGELVRAGIALYGGNPFVGRQNPVDPVVSLRAPIIQLRKIASAGTVGYGASRVVEPGALIATVAIGYADGYLRSLGNSGVASIRGVRVPVVGRVSMDLLALDVTELAGEGLDPGEEVELYGTTVTIDEVAESAGTISYELLTRLGRRVQRRYRNAPDSTV